jgi:protein-L-isoaspartate O-methyltransferase
MDAPTSNSAYALGYTKAESDRLIRQAAKLAPLTERFFRDAGISAGHRVLELGSGMGDVAMLVAKIVGPSGSVIGVERDRNSIRLAQARAAEAGFSNISFSESDISQLHPEQKFDAAVGRFILQFIPDPVAVVRSLTASVRPGGVIAFHEGQWQPYLDLLRHLPLSHACALAVRDTMQSSHARTDQGLSLHNVFTQAGLSAPRMRMEMLLSAQPGFTTWVCDLLFSLLSRAREHGISLEALGNLETLSERVHAEVTAANVVVPMIAMVAAWSQVPA